MTQFVGNGGSSVSYKSIPVILDNQLTLTNNYNYSFYICQRKMNFSIQLLLLAAVMLFAMQPTHAALKCSIATLRQCNSTNNSSCCQQLHSDPYFKMETGFYIGNILVVRIIVYQSI